MTLDLNIPLFFALYFGWKIFKRTKFWKPSEMDFHTVRVHYYFDITVAHVLPHRVSPLRRRQRFPRFRLALSGKRLQQFSSKCSPSLHAICSPLYSNSYFTTINDTRPTNMRSIELLALCWIWELPDTKTGRTSMSLQNRTKQAKALNDSSMSSYLRIRIRRLEKRSLTFCYSL